jgi:hypothetical protein
VGSLLLAEGSDHPVDPQASANWSIPSEKPRPSFTDASRSSLEQTSFRRSHAAELIPTQNKRTGSSESPSAFAYEAPPVE